METLGISQQTISIKEACTLHYQDIGHDINVKDLTFENVQARERTQVLMDYANKIGGLVVGTGDLSELALGWCTYNADQMSMYGVNASIPKTLIKWMIESIAKNNIFPQSTEVLMDIIDTPISPELLPPDENGNISQKTEDSVGPYELHDFFIYYMLRYCYTPSKIFYLAKRAFADKYDGETIVKWMKLFYKRFFMLSLALEKQNVLFLQKMMWQKWVGCFRKRNLMVDLSKALMGSTSEKMYLCQVPNFGFEIIKLRPGG